MKIVQFLIPRLEYILFAAAFWGIASTGPILLNSDGDLPRHLLVGKLIRDTQTVHTTDIFSFRTIGFPSIPHEWLSQVILSLFNDWLGLGGVVFFTALIVTTAWAIVFYQSVRRSESLFIALILTGLGLGASLIHVLPRPHLLSYLFSALWILILEQLRNNKLRRWWLLPLLMLMWVNLHGMFVLGIVIWLIYLVGGFFENPSKAWLANARTKSMLAGGALSCAATFLSPSGFKIWEAIASLGGNAYIKSRIPEYQSANFHMPETWPFVILLLLCIVSFARLTRKPAWTHVFLVTAFAGVALYSSRMMPLFAIVAVPILSQSVLEWLKEDFPRSRFWQVERNIAATNASSSGWVWILAVILGVASLFQANIAIDAAGKGNTFDPNFFPVKAVNWLESHSQSGHVFNEFDWGGYLLLKTWPAYPIFMDGHTHIYGEALTREYEQVVMQSPGWEDVLEKYQVEWTLMRIRSPLKDALERQGWQVMYQDKTAVILKKPAR